MNCVPVLPLQVTECCDAGRYMPILPMVLVNGAEGIGTGWSTSIPNYNPMDIVRNIKHLLAGEEMEEMSPWYRGFCGTIMEVPSKTAGKSYAVYGSVAQVGAAEQCMRVTGQGTLEDRELNSPLSLAWCST